MSRRRAVDDDTPTIILVDVNESPLHAGWFGKAAAREAQKLAEGHKCHVFSGEAAAVKELADRLVQGRLVDGQLTLASVSDDMAIELRQLIDPPPSVAGATAESKTPEDLAAMAGDLALADRDGLGALTTEEQSAIQDALPGDASFAAVGSNSDASTDGLSGRADDAADGTQAASRGQTGDIAPGSTIPAADPWDRLAVGDLVLGADLDKKDEPEAWYEAVIVRITPSSYILRFRDYPRDGLLARTRRHVALLHGNP